MSETEGGASDGVEKMAVIDETAPAAKLSLKVHEIAKDAQNHNGLRHGDYHQYRQYCTRRLKRVRSLRQVRFMFGKGKSFVQKVGSYLGEILLLPCPFEKCLIVPCCEVRNVEIVFAADNLVHRRPITTQHHRC